MIDFNKIKLKYFSIAHFCKSFDLDYRMVRYIKIRQSKGKMLNPAGKAYKEAEKIKKLGFTKERKC